MEGSSVGDWKDWDSKFPFGMRVLVVDDDLVCLKLLEAQLEQCGYKVTTVQHAHIALELLRQNKNDVDLVVTDIRMPDMDGFKLLEIIGLEMDMPVVMISADSSAATIRRSIMHGACDFLAKPVRIEELKFIWKHVVQRKLESFKEYVEENYEIAPSTRAEDDSSQISARKHRDQDQGTEKEYEASNFSVIEGPKPKKARFIWSFDMHTKFIHAVNQVGLDRAVPKVILDLMNVPGLSRENVASHLQKYRKALKRNAIGLNTNPLASYLASFNEREISEGIRMGVSTNYNPANPHALNSQFPSAARPCDPNSFQQQCRPVSQEDQQRMAQVSRGSNPSTSDISKPRSIYDELVVDRSSAPRLNKRKGLMGDLSQMFQSNMNQNMFQSNVNQNNYYAGNSSQTFQSNVNQNNIFMGNSSQAFQPGVNQNNDYVGSSSQTFQPGANQNNGSVGSSSQTFQPGANQNNGSVGNSSLTFQPDVSQYNSYVGNSSQAVQPGMHQSNGYMENSSQTFQPGVHQNNGYVGNLSQTFQPSGRQYNGSSQTFQPGMQQCNSYVGNSAQTFQPGMHQCNSYVGNSSQPFQPDVNQFNSYVGNSSRPFQPDVNQSSSQTFQPNVNQCSSQTFQSDVNQYSSQTFQPDMNRYNGYVGNSSQTVQLGANQYPSQTFQPVVNQHNGCVGNSSQTFRPSVNGYNGYVENSQIVQSNVNQNDGNVVNSSQTLWSAMNQNNGDVGNSSQTFWPSDIDPMPTLAPEELMNDDTLNYLLKDNNSSQQGDQEKRLLAAADTMTLAEGEQQEFLDFTEPDLEWGTQDDENVFDTQNHNEENFNGTNRLEIMMHPGQHSVIEDIPSWSKCDNGDNPSTRA